MAKTSCKKLKVKYASEELGRAQAADAQIELDESEEREAENSGEEQMDEMDEDKPAEDEVLAEAEDCEAKEDQVQVASALKETQRWKRKRKRNRHKKVNNDNHREERRELELAGAIFLCSAATKRDCFKYHVFGFPEAKKALVEKVKKGMTLFLFDIDRKILHGIYNASSEGGMNLEPEAFKGSERKFPAQVRFHIHINCVPLQENEFKHAIKENYFHGRRFKSELSSEQVRKLMRMFRPLDEREYPRSHRGHNAAHFPTLHMTSAQNASIWAQQASPVSPQLAAPALQGRRISARENDPLGQGRRAAIIRDQYAPALQELPARPGDVEPSYSMEYSPRGDRPLIPDYLPGIPISEHVATVVDSRQAEALYQLRLEELEADLQNM